MIVSEVGIMLAAVPRDRIALSPSASSDCNYKGIYGARILIVRRCCYGGYNNR